MSPSRNNKVAVVVDVKAKEVTRFDARYWKWEDGACFVCYKKGPLTEQESDCELQTSQEVVGGLRKCGFNGCPIHFHESCFLEFDEGDFIPRENILDSSGDPAVELSEGKRWICPQHECNSCHQELLRTRSKQGTVISCAYCVLAWHRSCVVVGSHHVNRWKDKCVMCPRHSDVKKTSARNVPYCVNCFSGFESAANVLKCSTCVRSFCECYLKNMDDETKNRELLLAANKEFVCGHCRYADYPRIGDYVMAPARGKFWPAKSLHAELIPDSLVNVQSLVEKLEQPGYVLVQWVEGLTVPHYAVMSYKDLAPFPDSINCSVWKRFKGRHLSILNAVKELYESGEIRFGTSRPLPPEVENQKTSRYCKIKYNYNGRLARVGQTGELGSCACTPINGKRCTVAHGCWNRMVMMECSEDCDQTFNKKQNAMKNARPEGRARGAVSSSDNETEVKDRGVCVNNFLRNHKNEDDDLLMEEKYTEKKGYGVFAKKDIPKGTELTEYVGRIMPMDEYFKKLEYRASFNNLEMAYYGMQLTSDLCVDARNYGNISRSINHSCDPNCKVDRVTVDGINRLKVSTSKFIHAGEELTYDYDAQVMEGMVGTKCYCGSSNCRGVIGGKKNSNANGSRSSNRSALSPTALQVNVNKKTQMAQKVGKKGKGKIRAKPVHGMSRLLGKFSTVKFSYGLVNKQRGQLFKKRGRPRKQHQEIPSLHDSPADFESLPAVPEEVLDKILSDMFAAQEKYMMN